jgi:hypothetical protein
MLWSWLSTCVRDRPRRILAVRAGVANEKYHNMLKYLASPTDSNRCCRRERAARARDGTKSWNPVSSSMESASYRFRSPLPFLTTPWGSISPPSVPP